MPEVDQNKTILLVVNRVQVSRAETAQLNHSLLSRGFHAITLPVVRNDDIPVELFDLSALTPADRDTVESVVLEFTGRNISA